MTASGKEQILQSLGKGETCACNPGNSEWFCSANGQAATDCQVWYLNRAEYVRLVNSNVRLAHTLNRLFAERLRCFSDLVEEMSLKDAKKRLVKFILDMLAKQESSQPSSNVLFLPLTREEIAQRIGTARETVARNLSQLKAAKLIELQPKKIIIRNSSDLEKLLD